MRAAWRPTLRDNARYARTRVWPILQAAATAVVAWYAAKLALGERETGFAPIAALICLNTAMGQQRAQAIELTSGVVLGVLVADLLVRLIGTGPPQVGLMVVLAMGAAALVGGRTLLMTEAGVSAIIIGSTEPSTLGLFPGRPLEGLIGGGVALVSALVLFPPRPLLHVGRAAQEIFADLGRTLQDLAAALDTADRALAEQALETARGMSPALLRFGEAMRSARETARTAPMRRSARGSLDRQEEMGRHVEFAAHNTRVMARAVLGYLRTDGGPTPDLAEAVRDLAQATWAVAASFDEPGAREDPRGLALRAAARALEATATHADAALIEIAARVRSTASDLARAAAAGDPSGPVSGEAATDELLIMPAPEDGPPQRPAP